MNVDEEGRVVGKRADATDRAAELSLRLLRKLFSGKSALNVGVRLWDGTRWPDDQPRPATLVLNHPGALRSMFLPEQRWAWVKPTYMMTSMSKEIWKPSSV